MSNCNFPSDVEALGEKEIVEQCVTDTNKPKLLASAENTNSFPPNAPSERTERSSSENFGPDFSPKFSIVQRSMTMILDKQKTELHFYRNINQSIEIAIDELTTARKEYQIIKENIPILQQIIEYLEEQHKSLQIDDKNEDR